MQARSGSTLAVGDRQGRLVGVDCFSGGGRVTQSCIVASLLILDA